MPNSIAYEKGWSDSYNGLPMKNPYSVEKETSDYDDYNLGYADEEFTNDRYSFAGD